MWEGKEKTDMFVLMINEGNLAELIMAAGFCLVLVVSVFTMISCLTWKPDHWLEREEEDWHAKAERLEREKKETKQKEWEQMKELFLSEDWIRTVLDFICSEEVPADRIEIWNNRLLLQTGDDFRWYPLNDFGIDRELASKDMYYANKVLHMLLVENGLIGYYIKDGGLFCEIVKV